jgi:hydroxyacylglutathione hydrolase
MIMSVLELRPFLSNCYIVGSEKTREAMIVDPGSAPESIMGTVKKLGLTTCSIVATHAHIDHIGASAQIKEATGAEFVMHEAETETLARSMNRSLKASADGSVQTPSQPDRLLKEGDVITLGELGFTVLHTPGHSPGGICLYGHGIVFCGDTLFNFAIGKSDFAGCSYEQLLGSIFAKLMTLPDDTRVFPGHGQATTIGVEREWNPFLRDGVF